MKELLAKLKSLDPKTWEEISQWSQHDNIHDETALEFIIQGEIQRAIAARGWDLRQAIRIIKCDGPNEIHYYAAIEKGFAATYEPFGYEGWCDSPAKAILTCYLAAIEVNQ